MGEKTKRYWWLKLREDFFDQTVIKKLRRMAGGDTYTIIYLKMQLMSLRGEGTLLFEKVENTFEEEMALRLDEPLEDVQVTLLFLEKHGLIEIMRDGEYILPETVRSIGSECDSAARVRNFRERKAVKALHCNEEALHCTLQNVTCNTEREKETELEKELEKDTYMSSGDDKHPPIDYNSVMEAFNKTCTSLPHIRGMNNQRRKAVRKAAEQVEKAGGFPALFAKVEASDFLTGRSGKWSCGFDWILKPANLVKILEGNYDNRNSGRTEPDYTDTERYANTGWEE